MAEENFNQKSSWKNPANVIKLIGILVLAVIVLGAIFRDRFVNPPAWQVSVVGRGEVAYTPDVAKVNIGVQIDRAPAADTALKRLNDAMDKTIVAIGQLGIDKKYIKTQVYSIYPQYDYIDNSSVLAGYSANQQLVVTIRNVAEDNGLVNQVISSATKAGANQINSVTFEASNIETLKQQARLKAIADSKKKAVSMANAAGVKLGKVVSWWENFVQSPENYYSYYDGKGGMGGGTPTPTNISSGDYNLIVEMNLSYQVK